MVNLAREYRERGVRVDFFVTRSRNAVYTDQLPAGVRVFTGRSSVSGSLLALTKYLAKERPQAIIGARERINAACIVAAGVARSGTRVIVSSHTNRTAEVAAKGGPGALTRVLDATARALYPRAHAHVAVSEGVARDVESRTGFLREYTKVVYNPIVDATMFAAAGVPSPHPWLAVGGPPVVLGIGRLTAQKNFALLIDAFALLRAHADVRLLILGDGEEREALASRVASLGLQDVVECVGYVDNPFAYLARARMFVLSSSWEGFGNVLVEAMAFGVPVVSTNCPSGPAEILADGKYGPLVPCGDAPALASAMREVLAAPVSADLLRARAQQFTVSRAADGYLRAIVGDGQEVTRVGS
jgi:glycosyltransferase involved in cell wall biosynthesis